MGLPPLEFVAGSLFADGRDTRVIEIHDRRDTRQCVSTMMDVIDVGI